MFKKFTRHEAIEVVGVASLTFLTTTLVTGCAPPESRVEIPPGEDPDNYLQFCGTIDQLIANGQARETIFGTPNDEYRIVTIDPNYLTPINRSNIPVLDSRVDDFSANLSKYASVKLVQHREYSQTTGQNEWISKLLPGTIAHLNIMRQLMGVGGFLNPNLPEDSQKFAAVSLIEAATNPTLTPEAIESIINQFVDPNKANLFREKLTHFRANAFDIPETIPVDTLMDIWFSLSAGTLDEVGGNRETIERLAIKSDLIMAMFVPKLENIAGTDLRGRSVRDYLQEFIDKEFMLIPPTPKVYYARIKNTDLEIATSGTEETCKLLVSHPDNGLFNIYQHDFMTLEPKESFSPDGWTTKATPEAVNIANQFGLPADRVVEICEIAPRSLKWFVVPNKLVGKMEDRLVPGLTYQPKDSLNKMIVPFGRTIRDMLIPGQY
ncbi:hypothetical protein KBC75_03250 [Candidatus Shapirobacteria bacterium]|nr:hypothetical protein [Candidatus Shapirobacteria bacterium]